jgi:hypothetical protein
VIDGSTAGDDAGRPDRGQFVLLAAVALAVALVPLVLAYLQLGYHDDVHAGSGNAPAQQATTTLERGLHDAATGVPIEYSWVERSAAVDAVRDRLEPTREAVTTAGLDRGVVYTVSYNQQRAATWAGNNCPDGPDRQFGPCEAIDGVIVQERQGRTHVLGVAFDVTVTTPDRELQLSLTVERRPG